MLTSRLFWRLLATYSVLTLVSATLLVMILSSRQEYIVTERVEQRLHDSAVLLRHDMRDVFQAGPDIQLQDKLKQLGQQTKTRLTLVADDGTVLGDSEEDPSVMENHRSRDELLQARKGEFGVSTRPSPTLGIPMMYYALRVGSRESPEGFVRVAMPMSSVHAQVGSVQRLILFTAILVTVIALALTYLIVGRILRPLEALTHAVQSIAEGDVLQEVELQSRDELGTLADSFNWMSRQLASRIEELQRKGGEVAENSERLETVLGGMIEGVVAVDGDQHILFANKAARTLLEFAIPDVEGRPIWEAVRNPTIHDVVQKALEVKGQLRVELELDRTQSIVELSANRLPGEPCPGVILVLYDVTELRRLENVRQQFVSNVSHELKTPLASIQAYTETLLEGAVDDPDHNREFLQRIGEQADRLHLLILDLLRLARIESGDAAFALVSVGLDEAVDACCQQHTHIANSKQVDLRIVRPEAPIQVLADLEGVQTILNNLLDNAINYTPAGGRVEVRWSVENSTALLAVQDTGIGIGEEHRSRIFERFYRVDKARSRELGGTGLGLSIVKHLTREFGGSVELTSEPGKGSTFFVRLPLA